MNKKGKISFGWIIFIVVISIITFAALDKYLFGYAIIDYIRTMFN